MAKRRSRYKEMERHVTCALAVDLLIFIVFLISSGFGIIWLKVISAILAILISGLCLAFLYFSKELLRQRSLWMSAGAAAIAVCVVFSLILNFPSPNPYRQADTAASSGNSADHDV